jgi:hypothetical protein
MVASKVVPEALAQIVLGIAIAGVARAIRPDANHRAPGLTMLRGRHEPGLAHARQDDVAAREGAVVVVPGRERRGRPRQPRDERAFSNREVPGRLVEHPPGHRFDAVHAGAQIDAIQIQLENLLLRQLRLDEDRQHRFSNFSRVALPVRQEERTSELLRDGAPALYRAGLARVPHDRAPHRDRVQAGMPEETVIFDGDERVLQVRRDGCERYLLALLVEAEPPAAIRCVEPGVPDASRQLVNGVTLARQPDRRHSGQDGQRDEEQPGPSRVGAQRAEHVSMRRRPRPRTARPCEGKLPDSTSDARRLTMALTGTPRRRQNSSPTDGQSPQVSGGVGRPH